MFYSSSVLLSAFSQANIFTSILILCVHTHTYLFLKKLAPHVHYSFTFSLNGT